MNNQCVIIVMIIIMIMTMIMKMTKLLVMCQWKPILMCVIM